MTHALKVGISGIRGIIGDSFGPQLAMRFAEAFGTMVGHGPVVLGRDTRTTGPMIEAAVSAGLQSVGCQPLLAGVVPTPTILMLTQHLGARGGVMVSASHNGGEWNALKFVDGNGLFLNEYRNEEMIDIYHQHDLGFVDETRILSPRHIDTPMAEHYRRIFDYVDCEAIRAKQFRVAVDCCNGVGAVHSVPFLRDHLGCEVFPVFDDPSGLFERVPEPSPQNITKLREVVLANQCAIGFAQDPDADRLAIVNERGEAIGEDLTLAFAVRQVLRKEPPNQKVVINLSTSRCVDEAARLESGQLLRTPIGEINVVETAMKVGAVIAGEGNGGVIVPKIHPCRDSYSGMALILEYLAQTGKTVSALRSEIPKFVMLKQAFTVRPDEPPQLLRKLRQEFISEKIDLADGVRVDWEDAWLHVRRSNTEPVIRLVAEANTKERATELLNLARHKLGLDENKVNK